MHAGAWAAGEPGADVLQMMGRVGGVEASGWRRAALCFLLLLTMQLACAIPGFGPRGISPEERRAYDSAMGHLPADPEATTAALERFLELHPQSPLADDAAEQLAQLAFADGRDSEGLRWLGVILRDYRDGDREPSARLRLAQYEYARDKRDVARRLLDSLRIADLSRAEERAALRLRVALAVTPIDRIWHLGRLRALLEREIGERQAERRVVSRLSDRLAVVDREIRTLIEGAAGAELEEMLRRLRGRPPAAWVALEVARRSLDAGDLAGAEDRLERAQGLVRTEREQGQLRLLRDRLAMLEETARADAGLPPLRELVGRPPPSTEGAQGTVGLVLPLSGRFADFGRQALRGVLLAMDLFEPEEAGDETSGLVREDPRTPSPVDRRDRRADADTDTAADGIRRSSKRMRVLVRDSGGDPGRAAAAVDELAADPSVVAILGPIFSEESLAAAAAAEAAGIPLVTLSHREEVAAGRRQVFRTRSTPADEVGVLVTHAVEQLGARRFAVLYPDNPFGHGMRKVYWDAVTARGGKMVAASSYDPTSTDFSEPIRDMIGYRFLTRLERKALGERVRVVEAARRLEPEQAGLLRKAAYSILGPEVQPLPPIVDFDVLFIPDVADTVALIAPGLAYHEANGTTLLGSSEWLDPELLRISGRHVSGAIVSTSFYPRSSLPFVSAFAEAYRKTFGREPESWAAQAFDAANLVLVQLASGREDRHELREGLLATRAYPGATGVLTMRADGNARRRPFLLRVTGNRFQSID